MSDQDTQLSEGCCIFTSVGTFEAFRESLLFLTKKQKISYFFVVIAQLFTSFLDLLALGAIGALSMVATTKSLGIGLPPFILNFFTILNLNVPSSETLMIFLGVTTVVLFLLKSVIALFLAKRILRFLSARSVKVSSNLLQRFFKQSLLFTHERSSQEVVTSLNTGVNAAMLGVLGSASIVLSETGLLVMISLSLFLIDPTLSVLSFLYFAAIFFLIQKGVSSMGVRAGKERSYTDIVATETLQESISAFREIYTSGRQEFFSLKFLEIRRRGAKAVADSQWVVLIPKYSMESALFVGAGFLAAYEFIRADSISAIGVLTVFISAASRILPSIIRIQGALNSWQNSIGFADYTYKFIERISHQEKKDISHTNLSTDIVESNKKQFDASLILKEVSFSYHENVETLNQISLVIPMGSTVALVGPSGAGKSTLADLMLGLITPKSGQILLSGIDPYLAVKAWPGRTAYVPQKVNLFNSTLIENIAMGIDLDKVDENRVWNALALVKMEAFVRNEPAGINTRIGEGGVRLSGGQRQRIGLARALYGNPEFLILDEATSALDAETENAISLAIRELKGKTTIVIIAHRLPTVQNADQVVYLENGNLIATGSFLEVRQKVPNFDQQAKLLGL